MKVCSLMENTAYSPEYASEHGLSLYIETEQHRILFDAGQSGAFADNAALMGIKLEDVDLAVLSHGHYDHSGGLKRFLELNSKAPVLIPRLAFGEYYDGYEKYIGVDPSLKENPRLVFTDNHVIVDSYIELLSCNERECIYPIDSAGLTEKTENGFVTDIFLHEQYLIIHEGGRRIVFSGCSHKGILNIIEWLHPDVFIGGFHFMEQKLSESGNPMLDTAAKKLSDYGTTYYTCHCTGIEQYSYLKDRVGTRLNYLSSGQTISI